MPPAARVPGGRPRYLSWRRRRDDSTVLHHHVLPAVHGCRRDVRQALRLFQSMCDSGHVSVPPAFSCERLFLPSDMNLRITSHSSRVVFPSLLHPCCRRCLQTSSRPLRGTRPRLVLVQVLEQGVEGRHLHLLSSLPGASRRKQDAICWTGEERTRTACRSRTISPRGLQVVADHSPVARHNLLPAGVSQTGCNTKSAIGASSPI